MSARSRILALVAFAVAIVVLNLTSANSNLDKSTRNTTEVPDEDEHQTFKCQVGNACEVYCFEQNKTLAMDGIVLNDTRCLSSGYHLSFVISKMTTLRPGWFVHYNELIKKLTIRDVEGSIFDIQPGAFDDCTFRSVYSLELRGTRITSIKKGVLAGLNNLKTLSLYANTEMKEIEENALEGLYQLEEFIMEEQKLLSDLGNITEKTEWKYLQTLSLSKNSFGSIIKKPTFKGCARVKKLNLSNSEIEAIGPQSFQPMEETIEILDLSNNRLKNLPSGLLGNLIRPNVQLYLSQNLWNCDGCAALELKVYAINKVSLIIDSPLICETPESEKGNCMKDVAIDCFDTTTTTSVTTNNPTTTAESPNVNVDHLSCFDQTDSYPSVIAVETEYQYFTVKQEGEGKISIEMNYPDSSLALVHINDHDYKATCLYNLKRRMEFESVNTNAGHLFCLIKKSSYATSPRNCLPFHFAETSFIWGRDRIVLTLICSFAVAIVLGVIIGWVLICRYRRTVRSKAKAVLRHGSSDSRTKVISNDYNSWSTYQQKKFFMSVNNSGASLRRSCSENSLASHKTYMTPSPIFDRMQCRNGNIIGNSYDCTTRGYIDRLPCDVLPPLPPHNVRRERIYETIMDPPFTGDIVPYVYFQRNY